MEFTYKDFSDLYYRRRKLRDAVVGIMELISGATLKIAPYMQDQNGRYSEEHTLATVEELLEALKTYLRFERAEETDNIIGKDEDGEDIYEYIYYEMSEDEIACYRGFLYCALRELYANYNYYGGWEDGDYRRVFGELITMAKNQKVYSSYHSFLRDRYIEHFSPFPQMLFVPETIDGQSMILLLDTRYRLGGCEPKNTSHQSEFQAYYMATDEEMERMLQSLTDEEREKVDRRLREYDEVEEAEKNYRNGEYAQFEQEDELMEPADIDNSFEEEMREAYEKKFEREFTHFESYEKHLDMYLHFQHLRGDSDQFLDAITGMMDFFMLSKGRSCFADPEMFYRTLVRLQKVTKQTATMIRENME